MAEKIRESDGKYYRPIDVWDSEEAPEARSSGGTSEPVPGRKHSEREKELEQELASDGYERVAWNEAQPGDLVVSTFSGARRELIETDRFKFARIRLERGADRAVSLAPSSALTHIVFRKVAEAREAERAAEEAPPHVDAHADEKPEQAGEPEQPRRVYTITRPGAKSKRRK